MKHETLIPRSLFTLHGYTAKPCFVRKLLDVEDRIILVATLTLLGKRLPQLKAVVNKWQNHFAKTEEGVLQYDWYLSENLDIIEVFKTYVNSEAVLFYFNNY